jgi:TusA-related sulfurtransferase
MNTGQIVHLVSDDPTADLEESRWAIDNNQELVEVIMEKNEIKFSNKMNYLFHILVKKLN